MSDTPSVTGETILHEGRFIVCKALNWIDAYGKPRLWESVERRNDCGAVLIIARLLPSDRIVAIKQYRPPTKKFVYEFPAGLIDSGETPEQAAIRELREETGYVAHTLKVFPAAYTTPGLSNESVYTVWADIDETRPENTNPQTQFDASEMIESLLLPRSELRQFYQQETATGNAFDSKLAIYILSQV